MNGRSADFCARLGIAHPIVQAPMGGGPSTPRLAAEVSRAGGLGFLAGGYLPPARLEEEIATVRRAGDHPFGVNLFAGGTTAGAADAGPMLALLGRWHADLGLPPPSAGTAGLPDPAAQLEVVLTAGVPVVSFTFGSPGPGVVARLRAAGAFAIGTATTVEEALLLEAHGVDAVVAQGSEAGAHRATFLAPFEASQIGTMALVPQVADAVGVFVIASGGIMDGRGVAAARALGAAAVQLGTAFLLADEAGTPAVYREAISAAREDGTAVTRAFSGRPARGIRNAFMTEVEETGVPIPGYPAQNDLTRTMRSAAAAQGRPDAYALWAGQGVRLARGGPAAELVARLSAESAAVLGERTAAPGRAAADSGPPWYSMAEIRVDDPAWVPGYAAAVTPLVERYGGRYLARTPPAVQLEGEDAPGVVVLIEWPSRDAAEAFYRSPEYAPHLRRRIAGSRSRLFLAPGEDVLGRARTASGCATRPGSSLRASLQDARGGTRTRTGHPGAF
jgi:nitronate monooxygenase